MKRVAAAVLAFAMTSGAYAQVAVGTWVMRESPQISMVVDPMGTGYRITYYLVGIDAAGQRQAFGPFATTAFAPARLALHAPSPNPFNPRLEIRLALPRSGPVEVGVYDLRGRRLRTLLSGDQVAGERTLVFFGDTSGQVYALDAVSGRPVWQLRADAHPAAMVTGTLTRSSARYSRRRRAAPIRMRCIEA